MEYILGGIAILICLFFIGYYLKKKYYKEIDRLEDWKMEIMNRPVLDEMTKVKKLNMNGETEELFEKWRSAWDDVVVSELPDVEEMLFDGEEMIDKYRFRKAKEIQLTINNRMNEIEEKIKSLLEEINHLVGSEEKNRAEIEVLKESYRENKKKLLAHRHSYGKAEAFIEKELTELADLFQQFNEKTENGNYLEARQTVMTIEKLTTSVNDQLNVIPELLAICLSKIPSQISELKEGYREMLDDGYRLEHINLEKEVEKIEKQLSSFLQDIEQIKLEDVQKGVEEMKESLEVLYDLLEKEVYAKHYLEQNNQTSKTILHKIKEDNDKLKIDIEQVQQSYQLQENELEDHYHLDMKLAHLVKRFDLLEHKIYTESAAHTLLSEELQEIKSQLEMISDEQAIYFEKLQALRKDEFTAREKVKVLSKQISETMRLVSKSNLPGLSLEYKYLMDDAKESISHVKLKLEEMPLSIQTIQEYLEAAEQIVQKVVETTNEIVETVELAERIIQYGNRYRSSYPNIEEGLKQAEEAFRSFDYKTALEQAASTVENVEPGALKKIEKMLEEQRLS
ncbi:septation ring formation regulator EzrA [Bacillus sp. 03113]|uniref:septation ring formation regulator EzrA n=1 Tax=Bacillus sp. 03113 TaxID=2578211 RepID=UPI0011444FF2|nr:septation ring formation regulator EzrA [Bacillus sp. 03113]